MTKALRAQAAELHRVMTDLVKRYQFRSRHESVAYGLTVMQTYSLDALTTHGQLTMSALARELSAGRSAVTRVVDELEQKGLALRRRCDRDRRSWLIYPTAAGRRLWRRLHSELVDIDEAIVRTLSPAERSALISVNRKLCEAIDEWRRKSKGRLG